VDRRNRLYDLILTLKKEDCVQGLCKTAVSYLRKDLARERDLMGGEKGSTKFVVWGLC